MGEVISIGTAPKKEAPKKEVGVGSISPGSEVVPVERYCNINLEALDYKYSPEDLFFRPNFRDYLPLLDPEGFAFFKRIVENSVWKIRDIKVGDTQEVVFDRFKPGFKVEVDLEGFAFFVNTKFINEKN